MILRSALPTGSAASATSWWLSSTAMTRPNASVEEKTRGGSRTPRPTVYPPRTPRSDRIGISASRRIPT